MGVKGYFGNAQVDNVHLKVTSLIVWTPIFVLLSMARVGRRYSFVGVCVMLLLSLLFVSVALVVDGVGLVKPMLPRLTREAKSNFSGCATATGAPCY